MPYFDPSKDEDKNLLHADVRDHNELTRVASQVEHDLINEFREEYPKARGEYATYDPDGPLQTEIKLHGYDEDPGEAEEHFKEAMRRTIAEVVSYCLRVYDNEVGIASERRGGRSTSYAGRIPTPDQWPDGWDSRLLLYDNRHPVYGL